MLSFSMYCICLIDVVAWLLFLFFFQTNEHTRFGKSRALLENMSKYCMNKEDKMHSFCSVVFGSVYFSCPCINCDLLCSSKTSITMLDMNGCEWKSNLTTVICIKCRNQLVFNLIRQVNTLHVCAFCGGNQN